MYHGSLSSVRRLLNMSQLERVEWWSPKDKFVSYYLESVNLTFFGKRDFAAVIK